MALDLRLSQKQSQVMVMTPQMQMAIKLLQLGQLELAEEINQEMMENPLLELSAPVENKESLSQLNQDSAEDRTLDRVNQETDQFAELSGQSEDKIKEEFDWENYLGEYSSAPSTSINGGSYEIPEENQTFESFTAAKTSLTEQLNWQLGFAAKNHRELLIGSLIIGNLNDDGYIIESLENIAKQAKSSLEDVEAMLKIIQSFDPSGVAARNLGECLLLQLKNLDITDGIAYEICKNYLDLLEKKNFLGICRALKADKDQVKEAIELIKSLDPRPGRQYSTTDPIYITPDVYINKIGDEYVISLNEDGLPKLKINQSYRHLINNNGTEGETKKYLSEKLKGAAFLIKSIHQRQRTIYRVTESIFKIQRDFLDYGLEYLKPMVLKDIADDLGFHESTISRVTTNKYVYTPRGLFELKFFFDTPINRFQGDSLSSESVKKRLQQIINAEDPTKPLSDQRIAEILQKSNIDIARRTVAKYREMLNIGSSSERRKMFV